MSKRITVEGDGLRQDMEEQLQELERNREQLIGNLNAVNGAITVLTGLLQKKTAKPALVPTEEASGA